VLVTGGSGFLGGELLRLAPAATGTFLTTPIDGGVRLDVRDADAVARAVAGHDAVIHTAYVQEDASVIEAGAAAVAAACAAAGARLVHVSTDVVFDGALGRAYREDDPPSPITDYGRAKLAAERAVLERCPGALVVRTSLIYAGPPGAPSRQEREPTDAAAGTTDIAFFTDELRSPVQVEDLAGALLELAAGQASGVLHAGGADSVSRHEFARLVVAARGGDPDLVRGGSFRSLGLDRPADCTLDSSRAAALLSRTRLRGVREVLAGAA
jgi:dTDP-4-dehydrorhamnose reductase